MLQILEATGERILPGSTVKLGGPQFLIYLLRRNQVLSRPTFQKQNMFSDAFDKIM